MSRIHHIKKFLVTNEDSLTSFCDLKKKVELILRTQAEEINWNLMPPVLFPSNLEITRFF